MQPESQKQVRLRLRGYMLDMQAWENRCAERSAMKKRGEISFDEKKQAAISDYGEIFNRHCSAARGKSREGRWFSDPSDFDPENEPIEEIKELPDATVEVRTQQEFQFKYKMVYRFVKEDGDWRLFQRLRVGPAGELREEDL